MLNKLRKGQVTIFGKSISVLAAILTLAVLSGVGLALLTAYVTISGTATVSQSVILTDCHLTWMYPNPQDNQCTDILENSADYTITAAGGDVRDVGFKVKNQAGTTNALVDFVASLTSGPVGATMGSIATNDVEVKFYKGYNPVTEECDTSGGALTPTDYTLLANSEDWYCARHEFNIAAQPSPPNYVLQIQIIRS
jgi:hypothetical protein